MLIIPKECLVALAQTDGTIRGSKKILDILIEHLPEVILVLARSVYASRIAASIHLS